MKPDSNPLTANSMNQLRAKFSVAPMLDWTDRHCRYFHRLLSKNVLLYSEMITTGALIYADAKRFLQHQSEEEPVVLQLGGNSPIELAKCSKLVEEYGYSGINLNIGCPSDRVQNGSIGACLMAQPQLVADCLEAMQRAVSIPVSVKHRLGIDNMNSYEELARFINTVHQSSDCQTFIIHARKAILQGLSPKENRDIPPLNYSWVYRIKKDFPELDIHINGGIKTLDECSQHLQYVDGVMIGREAYQNPYFIHQLEQLLYPDITEKISRKQVVLDMIPYIDNQLSRGCSLQHISRHMLGIFHAQKGGKIFRRHLSENAYFEDSTSQVILDALNLMESI